jgi:hypothetical protein
MRVAAFTGWTPEYVEHHLTLPRLRALQAFWEDVPPIALLVARYLGIKPKLRHVTPAGAPDAPADFGPFFDELEHASGMAAGTNGAR